MSYYVWCLFFYNEYYGDIMGGIFLIINFYVYIYNI